MKKYERNTPMLSLPEDHEWDYCALEKAESLPEKVLEIRRQLGGDSVISRDGLANLVAMLAVDGIVNAKEFAIVEKVDSGILLIMEKDGYRNISRSYFSSMEKALGLKRGIITNPVKSA